MATITIYPNQAPTFTMLRYAYYLAGSGTTWASLRGAASSSGNSLPAYLPLGISAYTSSNTWYYIKRSFCLFDTSAIPAGSIINSAYIQANTASSGLVINAGTEAQRGVITASNPTDNTTYANTDFDQISHVDFSDRLPLNVAGAPVQFTLNAAGISAIAMGVGAVTKFALRCSADVDNTPFAWGSSKTWDVSVDVAGFALVVNYTAEPAAPTLLTSSCVSGLGESDVSGAPTASASADVTSGVAPLTVNFTDRSGMTPTSWLWEFGDGSTSTSQNPSHTYTTAGTYSVRLTATNAQGSSSYRLTIAALDAAVVTPPTGGIVVPVGASGVTLHGLIGKIGYYAVDRQGNQVKIHAPDGTLLKTFGGVGTAAGKFYMPTTVSVINGRQTLDRVTISED